MRMRVDVWKDVHSVTQDIRVRVCVLCECVYIYTYRHMYKCIILIVRVLAVAPSHINTKAHDHFGVG